jgi:hypothetical protein
LRGNALSLASSERGINVANETQKITELFGHGTRSDYLEQGVNRLSSDLMHLSGNPEKYNNLLEGVSRGIWDEPVSNPALVLQDFNRNTGTYNVVTVNTYDAEKGGNVDQAYRIVQPGNTLSEIARDLKNDTGGTRSVGQYLQYLQEINGIPDASKIKVGQAIKLHKTRISE